MAVGGALKQRRDQGKWEPLKFFSRKLDATQARYSAFDRELLAAHSAVRQFRYYLEGRKFAIFTDHKPLTFAPSKVADAWSGGQQHQLPAIAEYTVDLRHVARKDNFLANAFSQAAVSAVKVGVDFHELAAAQQTDQDEHLACKTVITGLKLREIPLLRRSCRGNPKRSCVTSCWPGRGRSCHQTCSGGGFSTQCMDSVTPEQSNADAGGCTLRLAWTALGCGPVDKAVPPLPALKGHGTHQCVAGGVHANVGTVCACQH
jgi:hypothetical protein